MSIVCEVGTLEESTDLLSDGSTGPLKLAETWLVETIERVSHVGSYHFTLYSRRQSLPARIAKPAICISLWMSRRYCHVDALVTYIFEMPRASRSVYSHIYNYNLPLMDSFPARSPFSHFTSPN